MSVSVTELRTFDSSGYVNASVRKFLRDNPHQDIFQELLRVAVLITKDSIVPWNVVKKFADELSFMYGAIRWKISLGDSLFDSFDEESSNDDFLEIWKCALMTTVKAMEVRNIPLDKATRFFAKTMENQIFNRTLACFEKHIPDRGIASIYHLNFSISSYDGKSL